MITVATMMIEMTNVQEIKSRKKRSPDMMIPVDPATAKLRQT